MGGGLNLLGGCHSNIAAWAAPKVARKCIQCPKMDIL